MVKIVICVIAYVGGPVVLIMKSGLNEIKYGIVEIFESVEAVEKIYILGRIRVAKYTRGYWYSQLNDVTGGILPQE